MNSQLSRRHFLRGAGALVALPFLQSLGRVSAFARVSEVRPPLRMGIFSVAGDVKAYIVDKLRALEG